MINKKLLKWWCCGNVGSSSEAIVFVMCGLSPETILKDSWTPYPHDSTDFGRCYKLLKIFPEWKERIKEMGCLGEIWKRIASAWGELETLYEQENHKKLYKRLSQLQPDELERNCDKVSFGNGVRIAFSSKMWHKIKPCRASAHRAAVTLGLEVRNEK